MASPDTQAKIDAALASIINDIEAGDDTSPEQTLAFRRLQEADFYHALHIGDQTRNAGTPQAVLQAVAAGAGSAGEAPAPERAAETTPAPTPTSEATPTPDAPVDGGSGAPAASLQPSGIAKQDPSGAASGGAPTPTLYTFDGDPSQVNSQVWADTGKVTPDGHKLYTYSADAAPGDAKGDGLGGVWHVYAGPTQAPSA